MRRYLFIALAVAIIASGGGAFAYTYTNSVSTIGIADPTSDFATSNTSANQPDWSTVTDNLSENTTCGEVPAGDLFDITPAAAYSGDLLLSVHLTNVGALTKAYQYLNMQLYTANSVSANETPSYQIVTLQNGQATFQLVGLSATVGAFTQTSQSDFEAGTANRTDTATSPGDVILDTFTDNVTESQAGIPAVQAGRITDAAEETEKACIRLPAYD